MNLLKLIIFFWTFSGLAAKGIKCPKGQGRKIRPDQCEVCPDGYFQPEDNSNERCKPCRKCNEETGSMVVQKCKAETNTICRCPEGSVSMETDSVTCRCHVGHGLHHGECVKCKAGYFSDKPNSSCQKWSECSSGVKENGTDTKNVVCMVPETTTDPTSTRTPFFIIRLASTRPHEGAQTPLGPAVTSKDRGLTSNSTYTGNYIGLPLIILGIIGLLILTALTCKLRILTCVQKKTQTRNSSCRKPVEESGDGSLTSLKPNPEEL